ncbi:MAG TPA: branched-chain-amino-acid transaminase [Gaiellaceae bacterium]|jgi:branched-chain amino acid aminotransferase|nr:branched-chain-amino-acid transaminase [Gaiellaceae bacterium]
MAAFGWQDGEIVPWDQCVIHVRTQGAMTGTSVFEGLRGYWSDEDEELYLFRVDDHLRRLEQSAKIARIPAPFSRAELADACRSLAVANEFREDIHFLVTYYLGLSDDLIMMTPTSDVVTSVTAVARGGRAITDRGLSCQVSSWRRISENDMPPRVKAGANYYHGRLARLEANHNGYDNAIFLDASGNVAESTGACVMIVRDGVVATPLVTDGILDSITRNTVGRLAVELGYELVERHIGRSELYVSDEVFLCGTGAEVTAVGSIDGLEIGDAMPGPVTRALRTAYQDVVHGRGGHREWLTHVYGEVAAEEPEALRG